ncbi:MAG: esterase/lipase family protein [Acidimicrobiales bacterium]
MATLAVFVHGLGADESDFWGSTPGALRGCDLVRPDTVIKFWGYETTHKPRPMQRLLGPIGAGSPHQSIDRLGEHLWSRLRQWWKDGRYDEIRLLGHSMGGLVVASAVGRGLQERRVDDESLIEALSGVAFVATPLGGARLADRAGPLFELFGRNIHVADLAQGSQSRAELVDRFIDKALRPGHLSLTIFRASNDQVVDDYEVDEPLRSRALRRQELLNYKQEVLTGNHSGCVVDLTADDDDLRTLARWVRGRLRPADLAGLATEGAPVSVFVSRPSALSAEQQTFWSSVEQVLAAHGLQPRTLGVGADVQQSDGGMYDVLSLMRMCRGALILGLSQVHAPTVEFKRNTADQRTEGPCEFVTPWNHMEACIAFAENLPILMVREMGVQGDGVFDKSSLRIVTYKTDLDPSRIDEHFGPALEEWVGRIAVEASEYV